MDIEQAMRLFRDADEAMGYEHRGYPACIGCLNGVVAVADDTGENGSSLDMYPEGDFIAWIVRAVVAVEDGEFDTLVEAVNELAISPRVMDGH